MPTLPSHLPIMVELLSCSAAQLSRQHHIGLHLFSLTDLCSECALFMAMQSLGMVDVESAVPLNDLTYYLMRTVTWDFQMVDQFFTSTSSSTLVSSPMLHISIRVAHKRSTPVINFLVSSTTCRVHAKLHSPLLHHQILAKIRMRICVS